MTDKRRFILYISAPFLIMALIFSLRACNKPAKVVTREIKPSVGNIETVITSTATVQPQNRLEIKPPINGRIDEILVKEGEVVKTGQILARMSSTERAALLDAARARGPEDFKYWQDVYKSTPLLSPIDGEVIVSTDEPGQIITSADAVLVISDKLIVQAQVDETDVGRVRVGQEARIGLDAYPDIKVHGKVDHIYYESKIVNNVTIYQVDIIPETVPSVFRSGMSATVNIVEKSRENVLTIPIEAIRRVKDGAFVTIRKGFGQKNIERKIELGAADDKNVEVISGLVPDDIVIITSQKYTPPSEKKAGTSPFMPVRRR